MKPPVWVIDTNVLVSAALTAGGTCDRVIRAAVDGRVRIAWTAEMLAEYRAVLLRPRFKLSPGVVASILAVFGPIDQVTPVPAPALPDADDEAFLAAALATSDRLLVTGNTAHFPAEACAPVTILTPAQALESLQRPTD